MSFHSAPPTNNLKKENTHISSLTFRRGVPPVSTAGLIGDGSWKKNEKQTHRVNCQYQDYN